MTWPDWIETLKSRYLADEASVFLLHGALQGVTWDIAGESLDAAGVLITFLSRTRPLIGTVRADGKLDFPTMHEAAHFERIVSAAEVVQGSTLRAADDPRLTALGRVWLALSTTGMDQAWLIEDTQLLLPSHRRRVDPLPRGVPALFDWPSIPTLRQSNNLVVFFASEPGAVRQELVDAASVIEVQAPAAGRPAPPLQTAERPTAAPLPPTQSVATPPEPPELDLEESVRAALLAHPTTAWASKLPVMDAVSRVLQRALPTVFGELEFSLDTEGSPVVTGDTAEAFLQAWRSDIALDAAAGMLISRLAEAPGNLDVLDATAMGALQRRVGKLVVRVASREL